MCACVRERVCVHACVRVRARARVRARVYVCVCVRVCVRALARVCVWCICGVVCHSEHMWWCVYDVVWRCGVVLL